LVRNVFQIEIIITKKYIYINIVPIKLLLLHLEINNILYKIFFIVSIKLSTILPRTKFIRQGPQFSWFFSMQQNQVKYHQEQN
jgi:hypothetical protein